jgi:transcriptional regulator with XRE-family HTH domain
MNATMGTKPSPTFNPIMLRWARDRAGVSIEEAAKRVSVKEKQVIEWERDRPGAAPIVRQARLLADLYKRSFLEFFRSEPPSLPEPELIPDFRLFRAADSRNRTTPLPFWVPRDAGRYGGDRAGSKSNGRRLP